MADAQKLQLLIADLRDFYDVERQLTGALAKLPEGTSWSALRNAFETHLTETRHEIGRLERAIESVWQISHDYHRDPSLISSASDARMSRSQPASAAVSLGVPHNREDYDDEDDDDGGLVAWARAISDGDIDESHADDVAEPELSDADASASQPTDERPPDRRH